MDKYLQTIKEISENITPLLGVIALLIGIILLIEIIKTVKTVNKVLEKSTGTISLVDQSLNKVQAPLDTAVKISTTVDKAHDSTIEGIKTAKEFVSKNAGEIKDKVKTYITKPQDNNDEDLFREPSPEDILRGE